MMDHYARKFMVLPVPSLFGMPMPACWTTADNYVFFSAYEGKATVFYGAWEPGPANPGRGAGYVYRTALSDKILTIELCFMPIKEGNPGGFDPDPNRLYDKIEIDMTDLDVDGKVKIRLDSGAWTTYYNAGPTWSDGYDNVFPGVNGWR